MKDSDGYESIAYDVSGPAGTFRLEARYRDLTKFGDDATTWHVLQGAASFRVTVTGRTASTNEHPLAPTEALQLAMLLAVRDEVDAILRVAGKLEAGKDYTVTVTREHLADGEEHAARLRK